MFGDMGKMMGMMKNLQGLAGKAKEQQERLRSKQVSAEAGGGMVKATMNGLGDLTGIEIDPGIITPEDPEMLSDLIVAAIAATRKKVQVQRSEALKDLTGGIDVSKFGINLDEILS